MKMKFINRVKNTLLDRNRKELQEIEKKILELSKIAQPQEKSDNTEEQKQTLSNDGIKDLRIKFDFVANFTRIEKILEEIKKVPIIYDDSSLVDEDYPDDLAIFEEINRKKKLLDLLEKLNEKIRYIKETDVDELQKDNEQPKNTENQENTEQPKRGILAKLFKKKEIVKQDTTEEEEEKEEPVFEKYKRIILEFKEKYDSFLVMNPLTGFKMDKLSAKKLLNNVNELLVAQKRGIQLEENEIRYLELHQPPELWKEIIKYYSNIQIILDIIQSFEINIGRYEQQYLENPRLFDLDNIERVLKENEQIIAEINSKKPEINSGKDEKDKKLQLRILQDKRKELMKSNQKIEKANSLQELGYKNKDEASKELSLETKDYIVIPISNKIKNISDLFIEEKKIKVEIDGMAFNAIYENDVAEGKVNKFDNTGENAVLLVPIGELTKEDIDSIRGGKIRLNQSVLKLQGLKVIMPAGRKIDLGEAQIEIQEYTHEDIKKHVKRFFGEDYLEGNEEPEKYEIFKGIPENSSKEKRIRKEAVKQCLFENAQRDISSTDKILVNGKRFVLSDEDEQEMKSKAKKEPFNEELLQKVSDDILTYLIENGKSGIKIDKFYEILLLEYMRVNKEARANYLRENNTFISIGEKRISIKPKIPAKEKDIAKRYSRSDENIAYKIMKLANLINKFAHKTENEELQGVLFGVKNDLIEKVIDLAKDNPKIKVKKKFDEKKMMTAVIVEIQGYNMIALHIRKDKMSIMSKSNKLEKNETDITQTSEILMPGVNKELLLIMKKMNTDERVKFLVDLDPNTFYKLVLRMGYDSESIKSYEDRTEFIKSMVSDEKIEEILKESEEIEKE